MSLFSKGNWSVFGVEPESLSKFQESLKVDSLVVKVSQLAALAIAKMNEEPTLGINPFGSPRLDEGVGMSQNGNGDSCVVLDILKSIKEGEKTISLDPIQAFLPSEDSLSLGNKVYAFWAVFNGNKDISDPVSKKEALAYSRMGRPFRFLNKEEKTAIEQEVSSTSVLTRKQLPVILDFQHRRAYAESTSKDDLLALRDLLADLGVKTFSLFWRFGEGSWVAKLLTKINKDSGYTGQMASRADELSRFRPDEIAKLEDKTMEQIVSNYFAFTILGNGLVAALGCPAAVQIHQTSDSVGVSNPSVAFTLLNHIQFNDALVSESSLTIVEPILKKTKNGEKTVNKPVLSVTVGENINNYDAGAAMLKGLDLPQFKRHCKTAAKAKGGLEIKDYWSQWLSGLHDATLVVTDCILSTLDLKGDTTYGLVVYESEVDGNEAEEESGVSIVEVPDTNPCKEIEIEES